MRGGEVDYRPVWGPYTSTKSPALVENRPSAAAIQKDEEAAAEMSHGYPFRCMNWDHTKGSDQQRASPGLHLGSGNTEADH